MKQIEQHYSNTSNLHETFLLFFVAIMVDFTVADAYLAASPDQLEIQL